MKKVTILLSVYNGAKYLREQLVSILNQKNVSIRIIIRDDCSTDNSVNLINQFIKDTSCPIKLIKGDNLGFAESFSALLKEAYIYHPDSDYYAFADQDDVWMEDKLISAITKISEIEDATLPCGYCSNCTLVDSNLNYIRLMHNRKIEISKERALIQNIATGCTMLFNYTALKYYVENKPAKILVHDYFMYLICIYLGRFIYDSESHINYRQHSNNQIGSKSWPCRMKRRITRFGASDGYFERHNKAFLESYKHLLAIEDILRISYLCNYRNSLFSKLALLFDGKYKYDNFEFNVFMCLKILLGKL